MSGSTRERGAAVIGRKTFHPVLSSLLYWLGSLLPFTRARFAFLACTLTSLENVGFAAAESREKCRARPRPRNGSSTLERSIA